MDVFAALLALAAIGALFLAWRRGSAIRAGLPVIPALGAAALWRCGRRVMVPSTPPSTSSWR